jgi:broad specificity phosphatase PhoE/GNAT superfamily N-acetyltransferase
LRIVSARERDIPSWLDLAAEVEPLFGPMVDDPGFHGALHRNVARGTAFCVRAADGPPGAPLAGGLLFSPHPPQYRIGWLAVSEGWRRRGVGRALVERAFSLVEPPAEMAVTTFGPDLEEGEPARHFYTQLGFVPAEMAAPGPDGRSRQVYRRMFGDGPWLILGRHSSPEIDPAVPGSQWRLSEEGRRRCYLLAQRLSPYGLSAVLSSVEPKAVETAQIVARQLGLPCEAVEGLQEHDRSNEVGLDLAQFHDAVARLFAHPNELVFGRETAEQARTRFAGALEGALARYPEDNVAAIAHGTVLSLFLAHVAGLDAHAFWQRLGLPCFVVLSRPDLRLVTVVEDLLVGQPRGQ